eukprot:13379243-Alexandrium_andersonii.AAC.1
MVMTTTAMAVVMQCQGYRNHCPMAGALAPRDPSPLSGRTGAGGSGPCERLQDLLRVAPRGQQLRDTKCFKRLQRAASAL